MNVVDRAASSLGEVARAAGLGARVSGLVDTNPVPADWRHVTKVDPESEKKLPLLYPLYLQHTDAISVGGSRDVDSQNTEETFELLSYSDAPVFHEPSAPRHVTDRTRRMSDFLAIPEVLNGDVESLVGKLGAGTEYIRETLAPELIGRKLPWLPNRFVTPLADFATGWLIENAVFEAYIIQNLESAAAREAGVGSDDLLTPEEAARRALAAEKRLGSEVIYLEYSGTYGGEEAATTLSAIDDAVTWPRIWYGGGLRDRDGVDRVLGAGADAVIVGNAFHDVAEEEQRLCSEAMDELDLAASRSTVRTWLTESIDVAESHAAAYLSTVPTTSDPVGTAERYLVTSIRFRLCLESCTSEAGDLHDSVALDRYVAECDIAALPGATWLRGAIGDDADRLMRELVRASLGPRNGLDTGGFPFDHVGAIEID